LTSKIKFDYSFYPVGQGLFSSGILYEEDQFIPRFVWVYDCGTLSRQHLITRSISSFKNQISNHNKIDLLVLSHFDKDHISGVLKLLDEFSVETLLLPYIPQWQRLLIAFKQGISPNEDIINFFINPTSYLHNKNDKISTAIYVLPTGEKAIPSSNRNVDIDKDLGLIFKEMMLDDKEEDASLQSSNSSTKVTYLQQGSDLLLPGLWEFVPYNDQEFEPSCNAKFLKAVINESSNLLTSCDLNDRKRALDKIKKTYDDQFGSFSYRRNIISLFLYGGPIYNTWKKTGLCRGTIHQCRNQYNNCCQLLPEFCENCGDDYCQSTKCSILYTGDGYLHNSSRLYNLIEHIGKPRIGNVGVFQVMHHGAEGNWHAGLAQKVDPVVSIFSSDPGNRKYKHPHAPVLRDFWLNCPVQVDNNNGAFISGDMCK